ncbi:MAG: SIS domain-containing protein [Rickettsiales bacterium]|mgnify:CR=1 FL=1|jgi:D-sedoheptulose 7-phosphate isomerase|nr:SIS domain-containing protein [Rickettsiales bacterium]
MDDYNTDWLDDYFDRYKKLAFEKEIYPDLITFKEMALEVKANNKKIIFIGNGASAATSSHCAVDFTKQAGVRSITFNEAGLLTCFANDFGYENSHAKALDFYALEGDLVVLVSCSGNSPNIVKAAEFAKSKGLKIITFTGCSADNASRQLGDLNFWVDSKAYNVIESIHMMWITCVVDLIVGKAEYSVS